MEQIAGKPEALTDKEFHYCPGCTHGIVHRLVAEVIDELEIQEETIGVAPVGCAVLAYEYFDVDMHQAAHGRAPALATGIKRVHSDKTVFTYQGDGDLAAIGTAEIVHAAARGEELTTIFINNAIFGMTGGQMAPTTLLDQKATTSPEGRKVKDAGYPIRMSEMLATLDGSTYIARVSVDSPQNIKKAKKAIKKAFEIQVEGKGFALVEVLSTCPTNWGVSPQEAIEWLQDNMIPYYPLGPIKDVEVEK
ncbi:thiamine pyrophosphate-dependent enzyme [Natroniella sp. ANB-PHB2]|uniref:thiamine pyrophosphate-dependent enzyme n=1 Tax=Natroniella sp. ANB-PHB2 TaxID=3384444 RepID=UPI0038D37446